MATRDKYCTHENSANIIVSAPRRSPKNCRTSFRDISLHNSPHYLQTHKKYITACICTEGKKTSHYTESSFPFECGKRTVLISQMTDASLRLHINEDASDNATHRSKHPDTAVRQNRPTQLNEICISTAALLNKLTQERSYKKTFKKKTNCISLCFKTHLCVTECSLFE